MKNYNLISVIIPIYNAESSLERCVQSVLNQTNTNYEIILVNDGSTDFSFHICLDFAVKYKNIKIIQQRNKGLSAARNIGILAASGSYIGFLDADDEYKSMFLSTMSTFIPDNDIVSCVADLSDEAAEHCSNTYKVFTCDDYIKYIMLHYKHVNVNVLNKIFRKTIVENIKFEPGTLYEDIEFTLNCAMNSESIVHVNQALCVIHRNTTSITRSYLKLKDFESLRHWKEMKYKYASTIDLKQTFDERILHSLRALIKKGCMYHGEKAALLYLKIYILKYYPKIFLSNLSMKQKIQTALSILSVKFFNLID